MAIGTTDNAARTMTRGWRIYHVWSRQYPRPDRRYCGTVWAGTVEEAGEAARREFGLGLAFDVQGEKFSQLLRKGA
jgi:hypothetical protein